MLTIKVNGREERLGIGCRTFTTLDVVLKILEADLQEVILNGETVQGGEFISTAVHGGDTLNISVVKQ
jgi:hypothetical protein